MADNKYVPGVCNIGPAERERRRRSGILGMLLAAVWILAGYFYDLPVALRILVFFPAFAGAIGFLQDYFKFCAYFGLANIFNFEDLGQKQTVAEAAARRLDRKTSWKIILLSAAVAFFVTAIAIIFF